jgi:hypothetical protein
MAFVVLITRLTFLRGGLFHDPLGGISGSKAMPLCGNGFCCFEYSLEPAVQTRLKQQKPAQRAGF